MRITYLCADSGVSLAKHNGSAAHVRSIVTSFVELGHDVDVLMADVERAGSLPAPVCAIPRARFPGALYGMARRPSGGECSATTAVLRALRRIWLNSAVEQALATHLRKRRPHLVYERHSPFAVAGAVTARRLGHPHMLEVNAPLTWEGARHRGQALGEAAVLLERAALAATTRVVTVSEELRRHLIADGVEEDRISVVPNGVDVRRFAPEGHVLPSALDGKFVVGFVGSLKAWHGIDVLAQAFTSLAADPDLHLLVVGDGPMAQEVQQLARALPGRVTWTGAAPPDRIPAYVRRMHVAVAPYPCLGHFYFSPLKVLEYMAGGRAIVASRIGQLQELIRDGDTGLLVEPGCARSLAAAVGRLRDDADLRGRLSRNARADAALRHTWRQRASALLDLAPEGAVCANAAHELERETP